MRIALFHDGDPRLPRLRQELTGLGHELIVVGPGVSLKHLGALFDERRPDVIHSLGRGPVAVGLAAWWHKKLAPQGTRRAHDVALGEGVFGRGVDGVIDGSLAGEDLVAAYFKLLRLR